MESVPASKLNHKVLQSPILQQELKGYLLKKKQKNSLFVSWNKRWFTCDNDVLKYYKTNDIETAQPLCTIDLRDIVNVRSIECSSGKFEFEMKTRKRAFNLACKTQTEMDWWVTGLQYRILMVANLRKIPEPTTRRIKQHQSDQVNAKKAADTVAGSPRLRQHQRKLSDAIASHTPAHVLIEAEEGKIRSELAALLRSQTEAEPTVVTTDDCMRCPIHAKYHDAEDRASSVQSQCLDSHCQSMVSQSSTSSSVDKLAIGLSQRPVINSSSTIISNLSPSVNLRHSWPASAAPLECSCKTGRSDMHSASEIERSHEKPCKDGYLLETSDSGLVMEVVNAELDEYFGSKSPVRRKSVDEQCASIHHQAKSSPTTVIHEPTAPIVLEAVERCRAATASPTQAFSSSDQPASPVDMSSWDDEDAPPSLSTLLERRASTGSHPYERPSSLTTGSSVHSDISLIATHSPSATPSTNPSFTQATGTGTSPQKQVSPCQPKPPPTPPPKPSSPSMGRQIGVASPRMRLHMQFSSVSDSGSGAHRTFSSPTPPTRQLQTAVTSDANGHAVDSGARSGSPSSPVRPRPRSLRAGSLLIDKLSERPEAEGI